MTLVIAARKSRSYFHAHEIVVITNQPLRQFLHKQDTIGKLVKWSIELSSFEYRDGSEEINAEQKIKEVESKHNS